MIARIVGALARLRPGAVVVSMPKRTAGAAPNTAAATISVRNTRHTVRFTCSEGPVHAGVEPFLAASLLVAMRRGLALRTDLPVSPRLLANLPVIARRFHAWDPRLRVPEIDAPPGPAAGPGAPRVASFFSGGVDSFYTVFRHRDEITDLVFVHGFDVRLDAAALRRQCSARMREAAAALGLRLVEVETDLRDFGDRYAGWGLHQHGPALAAVALLLAPLFHRVYIPGEYFPGGPATGPRGSHPDTDPLFGTESVEIVHHGADVTRPGKLREIASDALVQRTLRVCFENRDGAYNCGQCSKCLRNLAILRALGVEQQVRTFARPLDLELLKALDLKMGEWREGMEEALQIAAARGGDPELESALRELLARNRHRPPGAASGRNQAAARRGSRLLRRAPGA